MGSFVSKVSKIIRPMAEEKARIERSTEKKSFVSNMRKIRDAAPKPKAIGSTNSSAFKKEYGQSNILLSGGSRLTSLNQRDREDQYVTKLGLGRR